jgi:hypothetical protein
MQSVKDYVDMWPRSYAVGVFGGQKVDVHFNRFKNILLDFELVSGCKVSTKLIYLVRMHRVKK